MTLTNFINYWSGSNFLVESNQIVYSLSCCVGLYIVLYIIYNRIPNPHISRILYYFSFAIFFAVLYISLFYKIPYEIGIFFNDYIKTTYNFTEDYLILFTCYGESVYYWQKLVSGLLCVLIGYYRAKVVIKKIPWNKVKQAGVGLTSAMIVRYIVEYMNLCLISNDSIKGVTYSSLFNLYNNCLCIMLLCISMIFIFSAVILICDRSQMTRSTEIIYIFAQVGLAVSLYGLFMSLFSLYIHVYPIKLIVRYPNIINSIFPAQHI